MQKLGFKLTLLIAISFLVTISVGISNYLAFMDEQETLHSNFYARTQERV